MSRVTDDHTAELRELEVRYERTLRSMFIAFQPIVHAETAQLFAFESLLRTTDEALPHPGAVFEAAARLHRMTALGRQLRDMTAARFAEDAPSGTLLFVNVHALDLSDRSLSSPFSRLSKIASTVVLEITEHMSLDEVHDLGFRVAELRALGFRLAIDDLGGGHERMKALNLSDADFLKLDMSLVRDIHDTPVKRQAARAIIDVCHDNGLRVIGEGVEVVEEARVLTEIGCDLLQGYFIGRPLPELIAPPTDAAQWR